MDLTFSDGTMSAGRTFTDTGSGVGQEIFAHCYGRYSYQYVVSYDVSENKFYIWLYNGSSWTRSTYYLGTSSITDRIEAHYYQQAAYYLPIFVYSYTNGQIRALPFGQSSSTDMFYIYPGTRVCHDYDACANESSQTVVVVAAVDLNSGEDYSIRLAGIYHTSYTTKTKTAETLVGAAPAGADSKVRILSIPGSDVVAVAYGGYIKLYTVSRTAAPVLVDSLETGVANDTSVFDFVADFNTGKLLVFNSTTACSCNASATDLGTANTFSITSSDYDYLRSSVWSQYISAAYGIAGSTTESPEGPVFMKITLAGDPYFTRPETSPPASSLHPFLFAYDPSEHGINGIYSVVFPYSTDEIKIQFVAFSGEFPLPEGDPITGVGYALFPEMVSSGYCEVIGIMGIGLVRFPAMRSSGYVVIQTIGFGHAKFPPMKARGTFPNTGHAVFPVMRSAGYGTVETLGYGYAKFPSMRASGVGNVDLSGSGYAKFPRMRSSGYVAMWVVGYGDAVFPVMQSSGYGEIVLPGGIGGAVFPTMQSRGYGVVGTPDTDIDFYHDVPEGDFFEIPTGTEILEYE